MLLLPTQSDLTRFYEDLGTSEKQISEDIKSIAGWIKMQPHLSSEEINQRKIQLFIMFCKNDLERTKESLNQYYSVKTNVPKFFTNWDPTSPEQIQSADYGFLVPLPKLTKEGYRVSLGYNTSEDYKKFSFINFGKIFFMNLELRVSKLDLYTKDIMIWDMKIYSLAFLSETLRHIKDYMYCINKAYPLRFHQIHMVNVPIYAAPILNLTRRLVKKKIADRIIIHKGIEDLTKFIDPSVLPINYGGTFEKNSDDVMDDWKKILIKHREFLIDHSSTEVKDNGPMKKSTIKKKNLKSDKLEID
ncbi:clavesin-2-like [Daktulosphaira vitifoliae]|uniref:clavesin-2-like n=1 Tax=Daktulosphaira vitifoliae TaxID=58002 RepID=UPI0021AA88EB|nr:clavesin-2-like [Daktulosphaira vitifoliae]